LVLGERFNPNTDIVNCRGSFASILGKFIKNLPHDINQLKAIRFFTLWNRVMRSILGEDVLSFRFAHKLLAEYLGYVRDGSLNFSSLLLQKFGFLDPIFCESLQESFIELTKIDAKNLESIKHLLVSDLVSFDGNCEALDSKIPFVYTDSKSLTDIIVFAAATDTTLTAMSYPEFCASPRMLPEASKIPPSIKLYRFVSYLLQYCKYKKVYNVDLSEFETKDLQENQNVSKSRPGAFAIQSVASHVYERESSQPSSADKRCHSRF
jgi:hypothetical protein